MWNVLLSVLYFVRLANDLANKYVKCKEIHFWRRNSAKRGIVNNNSHFVVAEGGPRADIHETGEDRQRQFWRGLQGHRQSQPASRCHQDHRPRGGGGWNRRHPAGNHGAVAVWQPIRHEVLWILPQGKRNLSIDSPFDYGQSRNYPIDGNPYSFHSSRISITSRCNRTEIDVCWKAAFVGYTWNRNCIESDGAD